MIINCLLCLFIHGFSLFWWPSLLFDHMCDSEGNRDCWGVMGFCLWIYLLIFFESSWIELCAVQALFLCFILLFSSWNVHLLAQRARSWECFDQSKLFHEYVSRCCYLGSSLWTLLKSTIIGKTSLSGFWFSFRL